MGAPDPLPDDGVEDEDEGTVVDDELGGVEELVDDPKKLLEDAG